MSRIDYWAGDGGIGRPSSHQGLAFEAFNDMPGERVGVAGAPRSRVLPPRGRRLVEVDAVRVCRRGPSIESGNEASSHQWWQ